MSALNPTTPGVYTIEKNAFPPSVAEVPTAIPAFIGYTQKAEKQGKTLHNQPLLINSFAEYVKFFGGPPEFKFPIEQVLETTPGVPPKPDQYDFKIMGKFYKIGDAKPGTMFYLYYSMQFFYLNGGGPCYIVSIGTYLEPNKADPEAGDLPHAPDKNEFLDGLATLKKVPFPKPTIIVSPDTMLLGQSDCYAVQQQMVMQCGELMDRVTILDIWGGWQSQEQAPVVASFRNNIGVSFLKYAIAYYPWLQTNIVDANEVTYDNVDDPDPATPPQVTIESLFPGAKGSLAQLKSISTNYNQFQQFLPVPPAGVYSGAPGFASWNSAFNGYIAQDPKDILKEQGQVILKMATIMYELGKTGKTSVYPKITTVTNANLLQGLKVMMNPQGGLGTFLQTMASFDSHYPGGGPGVFTKGALQAVGIPLPSNQPNPYPATVKDPGTAFPIAEKVWKEGFKMLNNAMAQAITAAEAILKALNGMLEGANPTYKNVMKAIALKAGVLPPGAAMAGIYTLTDNTQGVWTSPANVNVDSVMNPTVSINDEEQGPLNVDALAGKSINCIRSFYGFGPAMVWGARTLDGNSNDWKYISIRRTMIMIEQSVKNACHQFVFAANDELTWNMVDGMISAFLDDLWKQGALMGATPAQAFNVQVGLGSTMTPEDILEGKMRVSVKVSLVHPAEFIIITYEQEMAKSG